MKPKTTFEAARDDEADAYAERWGASSPEHPRYDDMFCGFQVGANWARIEILSSPELKALLKSIVDEVMNRTGKRLPMSQTESDMHAALLKFTAKFGSPTEGE